ncbi:hypothetical protein H5410_043372 [Solanum commersonii]|uniref:Uncharacterized protein n=1 Tax=Solanum commersonii TaxID=4109 RepID=A0A9J5XYN4_SOLCO|nr:hypothetical protein H5410_043372 [Solanum commersonii]
MYHEQSRISYARMLIEVNVIKPLPTGIAVMTPTEYCEKCLSVEHNCAKVTNARQPSVEVIRGKAKQQTNQPNKKKSEQVPKVWRTKGMLDKPHISDCPIGPETAQEPITQDVVDATDILERDNESPVGGQAKEQLDKGNMVAQPQLVQTLQPLWEPMK